MACAWVCVIVLVVGWVLGNALAFGHAAYKDWKVLRNTESVEGAQWVVAIATAGGTAIAGCKTRHDADVLFKQFFMCRMLVNTRRKRHGLPFDIVLSGGVLWSVLKNRLIFDLIEEIS